MARLKLWLAFVFLYTKHCAGQEVPNEALNTTTAPPTTTTKYIPTTTTDGFWEWYDTALDNLTEHKYQFDLFDMASARFTGDPYQFECMSNISRCDRGFMMNWWMFPRIETNAEARNVTLISNGGHLPVSSGYYFKEIALGFEFGVTKGAQVWKIHLNLESQVWTHIATYYDSKKGSVCVFIDGVKQHKDHCTRPKDRTVFVDNTIMDPFRKVKIQACSPYASGKPEESCHIIANVTFIDNPRLYTEYYKGQLQKDMMSPYYAGCLFDSDTLRDSELRDDPVECRQACALRAGYAMYAPSTRECACTDVPTPEDKWSDGQLRKKDRCDPYPGCSISSKISNCRDEGYWQVYRARAYIPIRNPLDDLKLVDVTEPARPEETMFLQVKGSENFPDIKINFKHADTNIKTYKRFIEFQRRLKRGSKNVKVAVTAYYGTASRKMEAILTIKPHFQEVEVGIFAKPSKPPMMSATLTVAVISGGRTMCEVLWGDGKLKRLSFDSKNNTKYNTLDHFYRKQGEYVINSACINMLGSVDSQNQTIYVSNEDIPVGFEERAIEFEKPNKVNVTYPKTLDRPVTYMDTEVIAGISFKKNMYELNKKQLYCTGALPFTIENNYGVVQQTMYYVENRLIKIDASLANRFLTPNSTMELIINIEGANDASSGVDVTVEFGDTKKTLELYGFLPLYTTLKYKIIDEGTFNVIIEAANFVSLLKKAVPVYVEKPITWFDFYVANVSLTSEYVYYNLSLPVLNSHITLEFGDDAAVTYIINSKRPGLSDYENHDGNIIYKKIMSKRLDVVVRHKFEQYKFYRTMIQVKNNISESTRSAYIQVGHPINGTYLSADKTKFATTETVVVRLTTLGGNPLNINLRKGDGTSALIAIDRGQKEAVKIKSGNIRAWVVNEYEYEFELIYDQPGAYLVKMELNNNFMKSNVNIEMCSRLNVYADINPKFACSIPFTWPSLDTSMTARYIQLRSEPLYVEFMNELECSPKRSDWVVTYNYHAYDMQFNLTEGKPSAPMPHSCNEEFFPKKLTVPPRSLPIGSYEIRIEMDILSVARVNYHTSIYVDVIQSPLKAFIEPGPDHNVYTAENDTYLVELFRDTRDPDVELYNMTGIRYGLWCLGDELPAEESISIEETFYNQTGRIIYEDKYVQFREIDEQCFHDNLTDNLLIENGNFYFNLFTFKTRYVRLRVYVEKYGRVAMFDQHLYIGDKRPLTGALASLADAAKMLGQAMDEVERRKLLESMMGMMDESIEEMVSVDELEITSSILNSVSGNANYLESDNQAKATNSADTMAAKINNLGANERKAFKVAQDLISSMSGIIGKGIDEDAEAWSQPDAREPQKPKSLREMIMDFEKAPYDGYYLPEERIVLAPVWAAQARSKKKKTAKGALKATDGVSKAIIERDTGDGKVKTINAGGMEVQLVVQNPKAVKDNDTVIKNAKASISVPKGMVGAYGKKIKTKFVVSESNPYGFDEGSKAIQSPVLGLIYEDDEGNEIKVRDTKEPISIFLNTKGGIPDLKYFKFYPTATKMNYHPIKIYYKNSSLHITLLPEEQDQKFEVFFKFDKFPSLEDHDFNVTLPLESAHVDEYSQSEFNQSHFNMTEQDEMRFTFMLPSDKMKNGTWYIGIIPDGFRFNGTWDNITNTTELEQWEADYQTRVFTSGCKFWNDDLDTWDSGGCTVGPLTTAVKTQCLCTHLTMFGADFYVPPNKIDFSSVFAKFKNLSENAAVFGFIVGLLGLYFIGLFWARRMDKADTVRWGALPLADNIPTDQYHYLLQIHTSMRGASGTESKISMIATGTRGDTGVRQLEDGARPNFAANSIANFIMSTAAPLGTLTYIRIWHDNSGKAEKASWHLSHIVLVDVQTGERSLFIGNCWLAVEEGDGRIDRMIQAVDSNDNSNRKYLFNLGMRQKFTNEHIWLSVLWRPTRSHFTRVQRLSCCFSLLFSTMIANAMFYKAEEATGKADELKMGPFRFTAQQLYVSFISTLIVFPINLLQVQFFRKCRAKPPPKVYGKFERKGRWLAKPPQEVWTKAKENPKMMNFYRKVLERKPKEDEPDTKIAQVRKKKQSNTFPHWCVYFAYISVAFSIGVSSFFTILYSLEWGKERSEEWLTGILLSIVQSLVFVQPFKILLIVFFLSCLLRKPTEDDEEEVDEHSLKNVVPDSDEVLMESDKQEQSKAIAKKRKDQSQLKPMDNESLKAARNIRLNEMKMEAVIKDIMVYTLYLFVLMFLAYRTRDENSYFVMKSIRQAFLNRKVDSVADGVILEKVKTRDQLLQWLNTTFLDTMFTGDLYNGDKVTWRERLTIGTRNDMRLGPPRLRQIRVKRGESCMLNMSRCWEDGIFRRDDDDYTPHWGRKYNSSWEEYDDTTIWSFQNSFQLRSTPFLGMLRTYPGGGYTMELSRSLFAARQKIETLMTNGWIDDRTEGLLIEFAVFNPNVNLFSTVIIAAEMSPTGKIFGYDVVQVFRLFDFIGGWGIIVLLAQIMFVVFLVVYTSMLIKDVRAEGREYFKGFWNIIEALSCALRVACVGMYIMKQIAAKVTLHNVTKHEFDQFINFIPIAYWDQMYSWLLSLLVFTATLRFIKMLRFNKRMSMMGSTLKMVGQKNIAFMAVCGIFMTAFGISGQIMLGQYVSDYRGTGDAILSLFNFNLGYFDFEAIERANPVLGPIYFFAFSMCMLVMITGIFITVVNDSITVVKQDTSKQSNEYEIVDFILNRFLKKASGVKNTATSLYKWLPKFAVEKKY